MYFAVISLAALSCGETALAQTNNVAATNADASGSSTNVTQLGNITVVGKLDKARDTIIPDLGATAHVFSKEQIETLSQGANAPFNEVILRAPGVAQDSAANGDLHVRGEHANLQYRINDVLLPEGITGFGLELDPRFVESMRLITGSLPAAYGFRTAGVVDIHTKSGAFENGGEGELYGGSYDTIRPSFEYGGSQGKWNYFMDGSYDHNDLGIENPTPSHNAIHDTTDQGKAFVYASRILSDTSRLSLMGSASYSDFEVPNTLGLPPGTAPGGNQWQSGSFDSSTLNENQNEQNYYGVATYQKSAGDLNLQASVFGRNSGVHFTPDPIGDLFFNGVASDVNRRLYSGGLQADASYTLGDKHTIRGGVMLMDEYLSADSTTTAILMDSTDPSTFNPQPGSPTTTIVQNGVSHALFAGVYLQDEWKILPEVTINYGARFDEYYSTFDKENQPSPRVNVIWQPTDSTTLHAGYARYFTPPPLENVPSGNVNQFDGTANESPSGPNALDSTVKAERANYFDAGISQKITKNLQVGVDGYYKEARNQLDDGLFGQTLILSAFNYDKGRVYGVEFTGSYNRGGFSSYANLAWSQAQGKDWNSSQFLFSPSDLAYVQTHYIYLDHDQRVTSSFGVAYMWNECARCSTKVYADALYGSGLRTSVNTPNDSSVPQYYSINLGAEQVFKLGHNRMLKARVDVVNLTDNIYALRNGSGVGVNAAQYGERLGFFGSISYVF
ncbi:MAG TPA: TonB-dependent receptor [Verrucomicrobiae bacterium]|nr:TonB-dependent receptor [Verrucomicrobiae bacterium]